MSIQDKPRKAVVSVVEMSEMIDLSKSRFYFLIQSGIFPEPIRHESCKRPVFDLDLQQKCLDIRRTGIGCNGQPVLFNRKRRKGTKETKESLPKPRPSQQPMSDEQAQMIESLKLLGLSVNADDVQAALGELYPDGLAGADQGEAVRKVFLHLRGRK
jgi:hypothetical protein